MPFQKYSPKTAKALFKSTPPPTSRSQQTPQQTTRGQSSERKTSSVADALKDKFEHTRALIASIQKERYNSDLERSRLGFKEVARARIEAAQRAALDDELRKEALEELRKQEEPAVIQKLEEELKPKIQEDLLAKLRRDLQPKVHEELKTELKDEISAQIRAELRPQLQEDVTDILRMELHETLAESVREQLYHELYPQIIVQLKEEYRDMVLLQLKDELVTDVAAQIPSINGHLNDVLDPALMAESETSDVGHPPSQMAVAAKRRFSDGFGSEDPDTRAKKLKTMKAEPEPPIAPELLPLGNLASQKNTSARHVDESLDEGEKADIDGEPETHDLAPRPSETLKSDTEKADQTVVPEDIHAEGDDELSQSGDEAEYGDEAETSDARESAHQQSDQDADAELEIEPHATQIGHEPSTKQHSPSSQQSRNVQYIPSPRPGSFNSVNDKLPQTDLGQESESIYFLRKHNVKTGNPEIVANQTDPLLSNSTSQSRAQSTEDNELPNHNGTNNQEKVEKEAQDDKELPSPSSSSSPRTSDFPEAQYDQRHDPFLDASPNLFHPSNRDIWPVMDDVESSLSLDEDDGYRSLSVLGTPDDNDDEEEEDEDEDEDEEEEEEVEKEDEGEEDDDGDDDKEEVHPYGNHYSANDEEDDDEIDGAAEEDEDEAEDDDEDNEDTGIETLPVPLTYSQGGRQDDPISLDSD